MKRIYWVILVVILVGRTFVHLTSAEDILPKKVFEKDGRIYAYQGNRIPVKLTNSGKDRNPILSPDEKLVAFIRKSEDEAYLAVEGADYVEPGGHLGDQIWIVNVDDKKARMIVKDRIPEAVDGTGKTIHEVVAFIYDESFQFSPDGKKIYFETSAWTTSNAIHSVNIDGSDEKFVTSGNTLKIIDRGGYKGYLITSKHKYYVAGGSYDWYWLVSPDGEEIGPLGDDLDFVNMEFLYSDFINSDE